MYVVKSGPQYLKELGRFSTVWVSTTRDAKRYASKAEADVVAFAVEGTVVACSSTS